METSVQVVLADGSSIILRSFVQGTELHIYLNRPGTENDLGEILTGYVGQARREKGAK